MINCAVTEDPIEPPIAEGLGDAAYERDVCVALGHVLAGRPEHGGRRVERDGTGPAHTHLAGVLGAGGCQVEHPPRTASQSHIGGQLTQPLEEEVKIQPVGPRSIGGVPIELQL